MKRRLSAAETNHLRLLVGWIRCDIGPSPDEIVDTVKQIASKIGEPSDYGKNAMVEWHGEAARIPKYIRHAVKMLERALKEGQGGEIVDGEVMKNRLDRPVSEGKMRDKTGKRGHTLDIAKGG